MSNKAEGVNMKHLRITKARIVEVIRQYRGKVTGIASELKNGGINPDLPYVQTVDKKTGDYIYMQDESKPKVISGLGIPVLKGGPATYDKDLSDESVVLNIKNRREKKPAKKRKLFTKKKGK